MMFSKRKKGGTHASRAPRTESAAPRRSEYNHEDILFSDGDYFPEDFSLADIMADFAARPQPEEDTMPAVFSAGEYVPTEEQREEYPPEETYDEAYLPEEASDGEFAPAEYGEGEYDDGYLPEEEYTDGYDDWDYDTEADEEEAHRRQRKALRRSMPFFAALAALTVFAWILPLRPSYSLMEKRELEPFPAFSMQSLLNGDWFDGINLWFSDTFPGREGWVNLQNRFSDLYGDRRIVFSGSLVTVDEVFKPADPPAVEPTAAPGISETPAEPAVTPNGGAAPEELPGEEPAIPEETFDSYDGVEGNVDDATRLGNVIYLDNTGYELFGLGEENAAMYGRILGKAADKMAGKIRMFSILAPNAGGIMLSYDLYDEFNDIRQDEAAKAFYVEGGSNLIPVYIYDNLRSHNDEYLFFRTDHHWTALAAWYAYEEWCKAAGVEPVPLSEYTELEQPGFLGSYYQRTGSVAMANDPDTVVAYIPPGEISCKYRSGPADVWQEINAVEDMSNESANKKYLTFLKGDHYQTVITNDAIQDDSTCLVIKDSYGNPFSIYLSQHYHTVVAMDFRNNFLAQRVANEFEVDDIIIITEMILGQSNNALGSLNFAFRYWQAETEEG